MSRLLTVKLSLPVFFARHPHHDRGNTAQKVFAKLKWLGKNITYVDFCKLFVIIFQDECVLNTCKEFYSSQISKGGIDLNYEINTFFKRISDKSYQRYWNCDENELRMVHMKRMSEENESCLAEIKLLNEEIDKMEIDHKDKVQEYRIKKIQFDDRVVKVYREAQLNKVRIERKNRNEMLINLMEREKELDDLEKINKENKKKFLASKEINILESEQMKKELFRKEEFLKMFSNRFSKDMLMRYKKKKSLEHSIIEKNNTIEKLKNTVESMSKHLAELQEAERVYLKREVYDKLDAIRERIALRTITAFIMPYVNLKFKSRKKKTKSKKPSGLNKKSKK
ncbi:uncharacterized protein LOC113557833 [Rhopalosiphum maidis]|uniref:uncharacterized protein LOC113557833 n=1 Tax=Rhopalosiphum maidis TaxID=43146 RepID=UPI000F00C057|nr:uncharacterized protein LOC113557833 [Rhopalosiphum maidis]